MEMIDNLVLIRNMHCSEPNKRQKCDLTERLTVYKATHIYGYVSF